MRFAFFILGSFTIFVSMLILRLHIDFALILIEFRFFSSFEYLNVLHLLLAVLLLDKPIKVEDYVARSVKAFESAADNAVRHVLLGSIQALAYQCSENMHHKRKFT